MKRFEQAAGHGCGCCGASRRTFLSQCAACVAGGAGLISPAFAAGGAGAEQGRPKIRVVFSHVPSTEITWPNIGYDYAGHKSEFLGQLASSCPELELLPVWVGTTEDAVRVMQRDNEVDGYVIDMAGMKGGGNRLITMLGKAGRPTLLVDNLFAGGGNFLNSNAVARRSEWNVVGLATSRFSDITDAAHCFTLMKKPGKTAEEFFVAADAIRRKNIPPMGDMSCVRDSVQAGDIAACVKRLKDAKIVLVGTNSLSGDPIVNAAADIFGTEVIRVDFPELDAGYRKADQDEAAAWADRWIGAAEQVVEPTRAEIVKSAKMYLAMRDLMRRHDARAITVHCLGGFYGGHLQAYPCLGFSQLNNDGLVGACEADLLSTMTMLSLGYLIERPGFISDPVIDTAKNQIIYAHCVAPSKMFGPEGPSNPHHIRSHSEDRRGAAVRSLMPLGYMTTTLKFDLTGRACVLHQAKSVENVDLDQACRTKLAAEVVGDVDKLLNGWSHGWHRVTFYGDVKEPVHALCDALGVELIEEA